MNGSIGVFVAIFNEDRSGMLLVQHSYNQQQWSLPGGGLQRDETMLQAGMREVFEETGLICEISHDTLVGIFNLSKSLGIVHLYVGRITGGHLNGLTDETLRTGFVRFDEMGGIEIYPAQAAFIRHARNWNPGDPVTYGYPGSDFAFSPPK